MGRLSMLRVCALVLVSASALCLPARAAACKCAAPAAVSEAVQAAAAVFEGRVTKLTPLGTSDLVVDVSVVRTWKGADAEHILLRTRQDSAACGFPFEPNESYLIYATEGPPEANLPGLQVLHCGRTARLTDAQADLAELGIGVVPVSARGSDLPPGTEPPSNQQPARDDAAISQRARPAAGGCASCSSVGNSTAHDQSVVWLLAFAATWSGLRRRREALRKRSKPEPSALHLVKP
jgi:hypothetical protein